MAEENSKDSESLRNSEDYQELQRKLEESQQTIAALQEIQNYREDPYFRISLIETIKENTQALKESSNLISKKLNNIAKVLAAKEGIEVKE